MRIEVKTVRVQGAMHEMCEMPEPDRLIVHSEQSLVSVDWLALQQTPDGVAASLAPRGKEKALATGLTVDNAWTVDPKTGRVLLTRAGAIEIIDPSGNVANQRVQVAGLPAGSFGAALDAEGKRMLLVVMRVVNFDFANYGLAMADLANGRLVAEKTVGGTSDLELVWDNRLRTWVIGDTNHGGLWLWDGERPAVKFAGPAAGPVQAASFTASAEGVIVSAVIAHKTGGTGLIAGRVERDRVVWAAPVQLPGLSVLMARRHPTHPVWACLAQEKAVQQIQVRDAAGNVLAQTEAARATPLGHLLWSASTPNRVWGYGVRALAAATVGA
jgi:hypothetical protein